MANVMVKRGIRSAIGAIVIAGVIATLVVAAALTNRAQWHTYAFPADPKAGPTRN